MDYQQLRQKYPTFIFSSFTSAITSSSELELTFHYQLPPHLEFTHKITISNLSIGSKNANEINHLAFHVGLAEMTNYWKLTCSPTVEVQASGLSADQLSFWHKLFINGFGQYFYENQIDFTSKNFLTITAVPSNPSNSSPQTPYIKDNHNKILVPLGGGKDSIVTAQLLTPHFPIRTIIVQPASPASSKISAMLTADLHIVVKRHFDPKLLELNHQGFLNGHVPYSAILATIFTLTAAIEEIPYIAVSNERSSNEGNVKYLGHQINHQYSKTLEFETDFNAYLKKLTPGMNYFSFLRPLYELQIAKLFAKMPDYFSIFKSCNIGQKTDSWCGHCPKCLSIAMTLMPWTSEYTIVKIMGLNPLTDPKNAQLLKELTDPSLVKPFECVTTLEEAQVCLEFIKTGQTARVKDFLTHWLTNPNMSDQFTDILKQAYATS